MDNAKIEPIRINLDPETILKRLFPELDQQSIELSKIVNLEKYHIQENKLQCLSKHQP